MFQRLYEAFDTNPHIPFTSAQNVLFNALPNLNLSSSGPFEFKSAIESVEPGINQYQRTIKYPNDIFMSDSNKGLQELAKTCSSSSIDELIAMKNPNAIRCGWMYTPPTNGSPYPKISQGAVGDVNDPIKTYVPDSSYRRWFFDLQLAKRTMLLDKCKALTTCNDLDTNTYKGVCGYCLDKNQGVPIDSNGNLLYAGDMIGTCSSTPIKNVSNCPVIEEESGPQPSIDRTCEPDNGRLSRQCLYNTVVNNGCSSNGSLAQALLSGSTPNYTEKIDAMKAYKKFYSNPLSGFENGNETMDAVLNEVRQLAIDTNKSGQIQFPAKDLCIRKGSMEGYDFCADLNDSTPPPFMLDCIQKIFLKLGGQPAGSSYPKQGNIEDYNNTFANIGEVKQYFDMIIQNTKSSNYNVQRDAMIQLLGIKIQDTKKRAPYKQGVEVFWFVQKLGVSNEVNGFLRRTIEKDIIMFENNLGSKTRVGFSEYANMIQLTDFRTQSDITTTFNVKIDDGFFITLNKPARYDAELLDIKFVSNTTNNIVPDVFAYIYAQAPTWHQSKSDFKFKAYVPNIVKLFYEDCYGGGQTFVVEEKTPANVEKLLNSYNYSLTCEEFAPFLNFEVKDTSVTPLPPLVNGVVGPMQSPEFFQETRNPGMFAQFVKSSNLEYRRGSSEKQYVPGKKSFARFNSSSRVNMLNIAYQSWKYVTFAIRLQSIPMNEEVIINFTTSEYNYKVVLKKYNELTASIKVIHTFNNIANVETTYLLSLNSWYLLIIKNLEKGLGISCNNIKDMQTTKKTLIFKEIYAGNPIYITNGTQNPTKDRARSNTSIVIGAVNANNPSSATRCIFDIAWVHFFDYNVQDTNVYRDCMADWVFTEIT